MNRQTRRWLARYAKAVPIVYASGRAPVVPRDWYKRHRPTTIKSHGLTVTIPGDVR